MSTLAGLQDATFVVTDVHSSLTPMLTGRWTWLVGWGVHTAQVQILEAYSWLVPLAEALPGDDEALGGAVAALDHHLGAMVTPVRFAPAGIGLFVRAWTHLAPALEALASLDAAVSARLEGIDPGDPRLLAQGGDTSKRERRTIRRQSGARVTAAG